MADRAVEVKSNIFDDSQAIINPATEAKQDDTITELEKLVGFEIPPYDEIDITYVATGNGAGEIETVIFSSSATPHTTLTLSYDSDNSLINVIKS